MYEPTHYRDMPLLEALNEERELRKRFLLDAYPNHQVSAYMTYHGRQVPMFTAYIRWARGWVTVANISAPTMRAGHMAPLLAALNDVAPVVDFECVQTATLQAHLERAGFRPVVPFGMAEPSPLGGTFRKLRTGRRPARGFHDTVPTLSQRNLADG